MRSKLISVLLSLSNKFIITQSRSHAITYTRMPLNFAANLNWLFRENDNLSDRCTLAKNSGFAAIEISDPYDVSAEKLAEAKKNTGLDIVLINAKQGDKNKGDLGLASVPGRKQDFKDVLEISINYAKKLDCKRMHVMAGKRQAGVDESLQDQTFIENITYAAERLQKEGILTVIEAVNSRISVPGYFLDTPEKAMNYVKRINHPNLKMQLDLYHLQIMEGNLTANIKKYLPYVGHMQIAQVPERGEPDSPGEINYDYVFSVLEKAGYQGWIGLEYKPVGDTVTGLKWMKQP